MKFLSLFSGIGGLDLGLERAGMTCIGQVEIDPYCRRVLAKHWPNVPRFEDVRTFYKEMLDEMPDLIAGGFPCQDISVAGKRVGIAGERSGLWSEFRRIICDIRPAFALVENTPGIIDRGISRVLWDLAASGYDAEWSVLPACALGASHSRARMFFLAYPSGGQSGQLRGFKRKSESEARGEVHWPKDQSGISRELDGVPNRLERIKGIGNAVVPQVAEWIGRRIMEAA